MSPPAFAAVLLALAIGGVLAWLAVSAEKSTLPTEEDLNATLMVNLDGDHGETALDDEYKSAHKDGDSDARADSKTEYAEPNEHEKPDIHDEPAEDKVREAASSEYGKKLDTEQSTENSTDEVNISLVAPQAPLAQIIALAQPDPMLLQETSRGALPIIGPDGREPWRVYGRKTDPPGDAPRLAIIVMGLGLSTAATASAIKLPKEVTLSFTAYGTDLEIDVAAARQAGHEVLLQLPMEPVSYPADNPGPHTLLTSLNPSDNIARLEWLLGRFKGYVGVITHMGSHFTVSPEPLRPILHALKERGLMFVDGRSTSKSVAASLAKQIALPRTINDHFLDHEPTRGAIDQSFAKAESVARGRGMALVVARPFPVSIERLGAWLPMLISRGIEIVPVTALADLQAIR